jgi:hypothetical protein
VEKGSVWTAIGHGWVAPKRKANALQRMFLIHREHRTAKGNLVKIPKRRQLWEIARQRNETATQRDGNWEESSFLFNVWSHDSSEFLYGEKTSRPRQSCFIFWSNSVLSSRSLKIAFVERRVGRCYALCDKNWRPLKFESHENMEVNIVMMLFPDASILFVCYAELLMVNPIASSFRFELYFGTWQSAVLRRRLKVVGPL